MGSLMSGWNSPRSRKKMNRTLSLTREEIDNYWRNKKSEEEVASPSSPLGVKKTMQKSNTFSAEDQEPCYDRAAFLPTVMQKEILKSKTFNGREAETKVESEMIVGSAPTTPAAWWTKTDLAFLNERPVLEVVEGHSKFKFASQIGVTTRVKAGESSSSSTVVF